ncbi:hypothetical protein N7474_010147 [Penicillium riverlandense]|uniref:uncharacterized protein n=1 Tax=Penicillium riverlandense TaxID=1903569 RepID=UPI002548862F|nr:uncharacterized protein N7474_010147 [Penicillium riverlandense]KAJ5808878.1 hypothetical protein N7474_010147 [Penicillium riverlandense]
MSDPHPNRRPHALFSLKALNEAAERVVSHPLNQHLAAKMLDGTPVLDIGFAIRSKYRHTIATLGRGEADVFIPEKCVSKVQCSFELEPTTNVIMLYDRSHGQTTQVFGKNSVPFQDGRVRKLLVQQQLNDEIGMGGIGQDHVQFKLIWHPDALATAETNDPKNANNDYEENIRLARTADEAETVLPSRAQTRIHTPGPRQLQMRYFRQDVLGSGSFGVVYKAIDIDTGRCMAVKVFKKPEGVSQTEEWKKSVYFAQKREVETLSRINHVCNHPMVSRAQLMLFQPYVVEYITSQGWGGPAPEIFMNLMDGSLASLVTSGTVPSIILLARCVFQQMLQALDFLAANDIVHRDIKPQNILYTLESDGQYLFRLGDFGVCNHIISAVTQVGTLLYMAPEVFEHGAQTHKMDVWSLFVTMVWTLDMDGFRSKDFVSIPDARQAILTAAGGERLRDIQEMARVEPSERSSAAQMLIKCFKGEGLTTPRNRVPPISTEYSKHGTPDESSQTTSSQEKYQLVQSTREISQQSKDLFRVKKSRNFPQARLYGEGARRPGSNLFAGKRPTRNIDSADLMQSLHFHP